MSDVEDYLAAQAVEYGTYVATRTIYYNGVRAYNEGDPVPVSNVEQYGYLEQGLVRRAVEELAALKAERDAEAAASRRVIVIFCPGEPGKKVVGAGTGHPHRRRPRHTPKDLDATLVSDPRYTPERWRAEGADVQVERLVHPDDTAAAPGMLAALGHEAERFIITCPRCGWKIQLGDQLGVGYPTMVRTREADAADAGYRTRPDRLETDRLVPSQGDPDAVSARPMRPDVYLALKAQPLRTVQAELHEELTNHADTHSDAHGVSRLSLSVLGAYG